MVATGVPAGVPARMPTVGGMAPAQRAPSRDISHFVSLTIAGTPADHYAEVLGGTDGVRLLKETLFARILSHYPTLRHIPLERFADFFHFDVTIRDRDNGYGDSVVLGMHMYLGGANQGYRADTEMGFMVSDDRSQEARLHPKVSGRFDHKTLSKLIDIVDFRPAIDAVMLPIILESRFPEISTYFHLDRLLQLALSNPDALTAHLREEIASAEHQIRTLLSQREVELLAVQAQLASLRGEATLLAGQVGQLRSEESRLTGLVAGARRLLEELIIRPVGVVTTIAPAVDGEALMHLDAQSKTRLLGALSGYLRARLAETLHQLVSTHTEAWAGQSIRLRVRFQLTDHTRTVEGLWGRRTTIDHCRVLMIAQADTPSYRAEASVTIDLPVQHGATITRQAGWTDIETLMAELAQRVDELVFQESVAPRHPAFAQELTQLADATFPSPGR